MALRVLSLAVFSEPLLAFPLPEDKTTCRVRMGGVGLHSTISAPRSWYSLTYRSIAAERSVQGQSKLERQRTCTFNVRHVWRCTHPLRASVSARRNPRLPRIACDSKSGAREWRRSSSSAAIPAMDTRAIGMSTNLWTLSELTPLAGRTVMTHLGAIALLDSVQRHCAEVLVCDRHSLPPQARRGFLLLNMGRLDLSRGPGTELGRIADWGRHIWPPVVGDGSFFVDRARLLPFRA